MTSSNILPLLTLVLVAIASSEPQWDLKGVIDCKEDGIFPSLSSKNCQQYLECKNGLATLKDCPQEESDALKSVCNSADTCGYVGCTDEANGVSQSAFSIDSTAHSPYYGLCVDGSIRSLQRCPTPDDPQLISNYNPTTRNCDLSPAQQCDDGSLIGAVDCVEKYYECSNGNLLPRECKDGMVYQTSANGCTYTSSCNS